MQPMKKQTNTDRRGRGLDEGFFRQAKMIFRGRTGCTSRKISEGWRKKTRPGIAHAYWYSFTHWQEKRPLFATIGVIGSFAATVLFAFYNGGLGIRYSSLWHGSICIYYILLSLLRGILLAAERKAGKKERELSENYRKRVFLVESISPNIVGVKRASGRQYPVITFENTDTPTVLWTL